MNPLHRSLVTFALLASSFCLACADGGSTHPELKTDERALRDFADRRIGFMVHWGPCTTIPTEISWGMGDRTKYEEKYKTFDPKKLDTNQWADVAQTLGARYAILVSKHHDGYCLWDTKTTDKSTMTSPLHRDVTREYMNAFRKRNILPGTYVSIIDVMKQNSRGVSDKVLPPDGVREILEYTDAQVAELMESYATPIVWFDGHWLKDWDEKIAAELYARMKKRNPAILTCRMMVMPRDSHGHEVWSEDRSVGDFHSMEARVGNYLPQPWEVVTSVSYPNYSWSPKLKLKTPEEIVKLIVQITTGNGNLLLNFLPDADGVIREDQIALAREVGAWTKAHERAIYGTRGGPWYPAAWGGATHRNKEVFLHVLPSAPERLLLSACEARLVSAKLMNGTPVTWKQEPDGKVTIDLPTAARSRLATVVALTMDRPIQSMVKDRAERSIFDDAIYGTVLSKNAALTLSSGSAYDRPAEHPLLVSDTDSKEGYAFHTNAEAAPFVTLDLGKPCYLRGIEIQNRTGYANRAKDLTVLHSLDGKTWTQAWQASDIRDTWSIPLTDFHDHAGEIQGIKARFVRLQTHNATPSPLHLQKVRVYGVAAKE